MDGPLIRWRGPWAWSDFRKWGGRRWTLRDPDAPGWPERGERTQHEDIARRWAARYVEWLERETHDRQRGKKKPKTIKQAAAEYLRDRENTKEFNTAKGNRTAVNHMVEHFGEAKALHAITDDEIKDWFSEQSKHYAPSTMQTFKTGALAFFEAAGRPVQNRKKIEIARGHQGDPDALSDAEIEALREACNTDEERKLVGVGLGTGARRAELAALGWGDFRADGHSVRFARQMAWPFPGTKGLKGKRNRTALVLPGFIEPAWRSSGRVMGPLTKDEINEIFRELLRRAGLYRVGRGLHVLRHSYGRIGMERYGWTLEMLRVFLGHTKYETTRRYAHFGEETAVRLAYERTYEKA